MWRETHRRASPQRSQATTSASQLLYNLESHFIRPASSLESWNLHPKTGSAPPWVSEGMAWKDNLLWGYNFIHPHPLTRVCPCTPIMTFDVIFSPGWPFAFFFPSQSQTCSSSVRHFHCYNTSLLVVYDSLQLEVLIRNNIGKCNTLLSKCHSVAIFSMLQILVMHPSFGFLIMF